MAKITTTSPVIEILVAEIMPFLSSEKKAVLIAHVGFVSNCWVIRAAMCVSSSNLQGQSKVYKGSPK